VGNSHLVASRAVRRGRHHLEPAFAQRIGAEKSPERSLFARLLIDGKPPERAAEGVTLSRRRPESNCVTGLV
ncbi:MAG: hypothetical protein WCO94_10175, partial [Verrucomicrobiota bacterium]